MLPAFLIEEREVSASGSADVFLLDRSSDGSRALLITLGITRVVEQESLDLVLHASADGVVWTPKPILMFPQKFYCGTYQMILDLEAHANAVYLRPSWTVNRWGRGSLRPLFGFYLYAQAVIT